MREIFIDVENGSNNTIKVTQGDNLTESYKLIITENKIRLDLTNKKVKFAFVKSDSHYGDIIEELKILNAIEGEVEFEVVNRITKVDGLYSCGLAVYDDKGFLEHTGTFSLYVRESIFEKVSGELIKNSAYKELISLLDRATNLNKEIDPIVINAEEKTNTLKANIKVADNSNKTLVDNTEKANTLNNTLVENTNEAKKTNENAVIKDNTLKETIKVAEANNNKLINTNDSAKEINNTLVKNMNEVKEVNENAINIKTSLENNINQATNLKSDLETEINKSVLANNTLIKSIDNATETNKDFINKDSNLKETIKNAENINEELSENENKATLNEATRKKNEAERIEAEKVREEKIEQFGSQVTKNKNDIAENSKDIERAFETINDNSFIPFTGEDISVEHSKVGFTKDMQIEGMTYQNLLKYNSNSDFNSPFNGTLEEDGIITVRSNGEIEQFIFTKKDTTLFKENTTYTVIFDVISNTINPEGRVLIFGGSGCFKEMQTVDIKSRVFKVTTVEDFSKKNHLIDMFFTKGCTTGEVKFRIYILEGDYTQPNSYIPPYFEGIKSVGEAEENKVNTLSCGKNLVDYKDFTLQLLSVMPPSNKLNVFKDGYIEIRSNSGSYNCQLAKVKVMKNTNYYFSAQQDNINCPSVSGAKLVLNIYNSNLSQLKVAYGVNGTTFNSGNNEFVYLGININSTAQLLSGEFMKVFEVSLVEGTSIQPFEPHKKDERELKLPFEGGLKGLPNGAKDIIYSKDDGCYVKQNIGKIILNGGTNENWILVNDKLGNKYFLMNMDNIPTPCKNISNFYVDNPYIQTTKDCVMAITNSIRLRIDKLNNNIESLKTELSQNPIIIYYELAEPVEYKISELTSINLETFKDMTYVSSENEIQAKLSFKAPVDVPATISTLKAANTMLIAKNVGLENKNTELEKVNKRQNEALKDISSTTDFLIEDALTRKLNN